MFLFFKLFDRLYFSFDCLFISIFSICCVFQNVASLDKQERFSCFSFDCFQFAWANHKMLVFSFDRFIIIIFLCRQRGWFLFLCFFFQEIFISGFFFSSKFHALFWLGESQFQF